MMIPAFLVPLLSTLAAKGLPLIADAIVAKGKNYVEDSIGVKIPDRASELTPELIAQLEERQLSHKERLVEMALKEKELDLQAEREQEQERTKRWQFDMSSDSWLSKNVRPATLAYWTIIISVFAGLSGIKRLDFAIQESFVDLMFWSYITILSAYYTSRGIQHIVDKVTKRRKESK